MLHLWKVGAVEGVVGICTTIAGGLGEDKALKMTI